jgi:HD-GYP domain-containing protein (c-di-GMP phosphodiesterase class II)
MGKDKTDPRVYQAFLDQLNEDFKQIQLIRIGMIKSIAIAKPIEYKQLSKDADEIRKRALRLKASLALTENTDNVRQESPKVEYQNDTIQKAASDLCLEISRFTTSPLFKPGAVYNIRYATEADRALDTVISISSNIKTSAEKLRKSR